MAVPTTTTNPNDGWIGIVTAIGLLLVGICAIGGAGYGLYEWVRPLTATEVCQRWEKADTFDESKQYITKRMIPIIHAPYEEEQEDADSEEPVPVELLNDGFILTNEAAGPDDSRHVGFRGSFFNQEVGRRVDMEGYVKLVQHFEWVWKIDDIIITGVDGAFLPSPMSAVDEYQKPTIVSDAEAKAPQAKENLTDADKLLPELTYSEMLGMFLFRPWISVVSSFLCYLVIIVVLVNVWNYLNGEPSAFDI